MTERLFIFRNTGGFSYNQTWLDFVNGFHAGDSTKKFWIGLNVIENLNRLGGYSNVTIRVNLQDDNRWMDYQHFSIANAEGGFAMTVGEGSLSSEGDSFTLGDCLHPVQVHPLCAEQMYIIYLVMTTSIIRVTHSMIIIYNPLWC